MGGSLTYGQFSNIPPFSKERIRLHFENNQPFVVYKKVVQTIEVKKLKKKCYFK